MIFDLVKFPVFIPNGKCSKISNTSLSLFSNQMLVSSAGILKKLVRIANIEDKTLIQLLLQKQSDLCLPFRKATSVRNFRTFTVFLIKNGSF